MDDRQIKLVIGSLLHDIGKVVYRTGDGRNHSQSGYDFLTEQHLDFDKDILDCVRCHHGIHLKNARIEKNNLAYITYFADNIAAAIDRRESMDAEDGFEKNVPLDSVFNILNGNHGHQHYAHQVMNPDKGIQYPTGEDVTLDGSFYNSVISNIQDNLRGITISEEYINSLLSILEANLMYIPSSTSKRELTDISLYDHVKMTAAVAECMYQYMQQEKIQDYKEYLVTKSADAWEQKMFLLYSMDISGIQKFIYTISSEGALRGLRARSFYLEIMMEHIVDELLDALSLSRSALIYCGGGHCYLLLPNTNKAKEIAKKQQKIVNNWFMKYFQTELYIACGYAECSASELKNIPEESYSELFKTVSRKISEQKSHRYSAEEILWLNHQKHNGDRECKVCRRVAELDENERCPMCAALERLSADILYQDYFIVLLEKTADSLPLPNGRYLMAGDKKKLLSLMEKDTYVRSYTKNKLYTGKHITTKIWVGNYTIPKKTFEDFSKMARGIERIAVLRGDVDNLGAAFVNGFKRDKEGGRYETLSRTATFSRQLSLFFKCYINDILEHGISHILSEPKARNVSIVYSGGDDIFLVGAWNEVIDAFIDIRNALEKFTQKTLSISGGIGLYQENYPINRMADETAKLEDYSKAFEGKNAVTLFEKAGGYPWDVFISQVLNEKYKAINRYFTITKKHGKAFIYHLLDLVREIENKKNIKSVVNEHKMKLRENEMEKRFNRARFVYFLSRMEPDNDGLDNAAEWNAYKEFSNKMYEWATTKEGRRQLVTAIYLYVYLNREEEEKNVD